MESKVTDRLVKKKTSGKETKDQEPIEVLSDDSSDDEVTPIFHFGKHSGKNSGKSTQLSKYLNQAKPQVPTASKNQRAIIPIPDTSVPSLHNSGPTIDTDYLQTPFDDDREPQTLDIRSDPSTMTHVISNPSTIRKVQFTSSSSSALPYSSPLQRRGKNEEEELGANLIRPEVRRADRLEQMKNPVASLERMASLGYVDDSGVQRGMVAETNLVNPKPTGQSRSHASWCYGNSTPSQLYKSLS